MKKIFPLHFTLSTQHIRYTGPSFATSLDVADQDWRGKEVIRVKYDENRVDEMVLALLHLTAFREASGYRTWKGHDWEVLNRLHEKGFIGNPRSKVRSVDMTNEGRSRSEDLFKKHFCQG